MTPQASLSLAHEGGVVVIEEGAPADVVGYDTDPRGDLDALRRPQRMLLRGRVVG